MEKRIEMVVVIRILSHLSLNAPDVADSYYGFRK